MLNTDLQNVHTERPIITPQASSSPIKISRDKKLKTADLGICLDQPFGFKTHRGNRPIFDQSNFRNYITHKNKDFAPSPSLQTISKIQSLENFFKNESLTSSKGNMFKAFNEQSENNDRPNTVQSYAPLQTKSIISIPASSHANKKSNLNYKKRINHELNYLPRNITPSMKRTNYRNNLYSQANSPIVSFF